MIKYQALLSVLREPKSRRKKKGPRLKGAISVGKGCVVYVRRTVLGLLGPNGAGKTTTLHAFNSTKA